MTENRSIIEKKKLEKKRLKYKKEVDKILRKWTIIYSSMIVVYGIAIIFLLCISLNYTSWILAIPGFVIGLVFPVWGLATTKEKCNGLYEKLKKMKELDERIIDEIEQQEVSEKKLENDIKQPIRPI